MSIGLLKLNNLKPYPNSIRHSKRCGRGLASGRGKTSSRGMNGQKSKEKIPNLFEGGQKKIYLKKPKRGMKSLSYSKNYWEIRISDMEKLVSEIKKNNTNIINSDILNRLFGKYNFKIIYNSKYQNIDIQGLEFSGINFSPKAKSQFTNFGATIL